MLARTRTDVDHVICDLDGVLVVLDDEDRVAEITKSNERVDEATIVALVQTDRRFVEHVEHTDETRADLRGESNALGLTAGEGRRRS